MQRSVALSPFILCSLLECPKLIKSAHDWSLITDWAIPMETTLSLQRKSKECVIVMKALALHRRMEFDKYLVGSSSE